MSKKWLDTAYQFDGEPSGGGGDPPPAEPVVEPVTEPPAEPAVEPPPAEPAEPPPEPPEEGSEPPEPKVEPPPAAAIGVPKAFDGLFNPPAPAAQPPAHQPPVHHEPPPAAPAAPPQVEFPSEDDWMTDPGKAGQQFQKAMAYSNYQARAPLLQTIEGLRNDFQGMQRGTLEDTVRAVQSATNHTKETIDDIYGEKGPFNSDKEFRDNPQVQQEVETIVQECVRTAIWHAEEYGDISKLANITRDPQMFAHRILALAKVGPDSIPEGSLRPAASPVGPQPPQAAKRDGLTEQERSDLKAARSVEGNTLTAGQIIKARKTRQKLIF